MARYSVIKYFGHFSQCWLIDAESDDDAWMRAEKDGRLNGQEVYGNPMDIDSKGYVINLDEKEKENPPVPPEQYYEWMREAINKGMVVTLFEYEKVFGLPFHDVW